MITKEQLVAYRQCKIEVERIKAQLEQLTAIYYPKAQNITGMPKAHGDADEQLVAFVETKSKYEQLLWERLFELLQMLIDVEVAIEALPDATMRNIMRLHYIDGVRFEAVAPLVGYELRQVYRLKKQALQLICCQ